MKNKNLVEQVKYLKENYTESEYDDLLEKVLKSGDGEAMFLMVKYFPDCPIDMIEEKIYQIKDFDMSEEENDIYYLCCLIEYISRVTKNHRGDVVNKIEKDGILHELSVANVNHCLSFEQVSDELIEEYNIEDGNFDTIRDALYEIPSFRSIGKEYKRIILSIKSDDIADAFIKVFNSVISDAMSNYNSDFYYQNTSYHVACFKENEILD